MAGFYIQHNTTIGLQCYAWGILFGIGSLYQLFTNALIFGTLFGYMLTQPHGANFFEFVTAHSAFELTAIIVSSAAGMRLGWGLIDTQGQSRISSLRREAVNSLPAVGVAVVLFVLAALVEGYVSASSLPYWAKASVAIFERSQHPRLSRPGRPRRAKAAASTGGAAAPDHGALKRKECLNGARGKPPCRVNPNSAIVPLARGPAVRQRPCTRSPRPGAAAQVAS